MYPTQPMIDLNEGCMQNKNELNVFKLF